VDFASPHGEFPSHPTSSCVCCSPDEFLRAFALRKLSSRLGCRRAGSFSWAPHGRVPHGSPKACLPTSFDESHTARLMTEGFVTTNVVNRDLWREKTFLSSLNVVFLVVVVWMELLVERSSSSHGMGRCNTHPHNRCSFWTP
jgi:hypothetical protein